MERNRGDTELDEVGTGPARAERPRVKVTTAEDLSKLIQLIGQISEQLINGMLEFVKTHFHFSEFTSRSSNHSTQVRLVIKFYDLCISEYSVFALYQIEVGVRLHLPIKMYGWGSYIECAGS